MEHRREITAMVVAVIDRMLAEGRRQKTITERLGVSPYVVGVIARDKERIGHPAPKEPDGDRYPNRPNTADAATIAMIRRMLDVGILFHYEIARDVGVSTNLVTQVALGKRVPLDTSRPPLSAGERFLRRPIRCSVCHRKISVLPCRACRTVREATRAVCCL